MASSPFLRLPGAVDAASIPGTTAEAGVPAHYGNPLGEQRALAEGRAIVDLSDRAVLTITGPDRLSWLNSLTSQALTRLQPGESSETLLLDVTGRVEHAVRLIEDGETLWLLVDRPEAEGLLSWLDRMRFMLRVELADRSDDLATIGTLGDPPLPIAAPNGVPLIWHDPWRAVAVGGHQYAQGEHPGAGWTWSERIVPRDALESIVARVESRELVVAGASAADALRIAAWRPRFSTEVDERTIPHELDWLRSAVHLDKGCYRGQETVAKVHNLGHPPRRLVMLHLDGSEGAHPVRGAAVSLGEKEVGTVTSTALHYELGPIALAVVKRSTAPDETLTVDADGTLVAAAQEVVVPPGAGAEAQIPHLPRLGAVTRRPRA
ncbi:glycine cleavage T C-terminal barrel domain-containing protein [Leifsonia sp. 71-9]|uniref:CAF17-like 4Fe-4S cluster assembly/insertion protein YgfZ n=1 Tax=Leifsonia sp. 71-9 TaxID=1895934 RepID=UPI00092B3966|nr:glycine cleavage T C-terminal barrel domain-containing protein [Leifsonia sp. 71-9]OJX72393.1 MAG: folate-binding protein YgfZ [Leifsonia sp. 71-9]